MNRSTFISAAIVVLAVVTLLGLAKNWFRGKGCAPMGSGLCMSCPSARHKENLLVINVLSKEFYDDAHIKGSIHIDFTELQNAAKDWDKDTSIVVYCSNYMCTASGAAAVELQKLGFTNVRAYEGGMAEWYQLSKQDASYTVEGSAKQSYLERVVKKPEGAQHPEVKEITATELKALLENKTCS